MDLHSQDLMNRDVRRGRVHGRVRGVYLEPMVSQGHPVPFPVSHEPVLLIEPRDAKRPMECWPLLSGEPVHILPRKR